MELVVIDILLEHNFSPIRLDFAKPAGASWKAEWYDLQLSRPRDRAIFRLLQRYAIEGRFESNCICDCSLNGEEFSLHKWGPVLHGDMGPFPSSFSKRERVFSEKNEKDLSEDALARKRMFGGGAGGVAIDRVQLHGRVGRGRLYCARVGRGDFVPRFGGCTQLSVWDTVGSCGHVGHVGPVGQVGFPQISVIKSDMSRFGLVSPPRVGQVGACGVMISRTL